MSTKTTWPPQPWNQPHKQMIESQTWWEGNLQKLTNNYRHNPQSHPNQYKGGIVGTATRLWLGKPTGTGDNNDKIHIPLPADIARLSANQLFSNPPKITLSAAENNPTAQQRIDQILNTQAFAANLLVAAELCSVHGGIYGRIVYNQNIQQEPWIDWVPATQAIPQFQYGQLTKVTFHTTLDTNSQHTLRHLETYGPGYIEHALYEGKPDELGRRIPLTENEALAPLAELLDENSRIATGYGRIAAAYIPNAKPNIGFIGNGQLGNLGRSDLSLDLFPMFDKLDMVYSSLMRDVRLGRARIVADESLLDDRGPGRGAAFDLDREVFTKVSGSPDETIMQAHQFAIRVDEHIKIIEDLSQRIMRRVGYSPLSFGLVDDGAMTATEVRARTRMTESTTKAKSRYWSAGLSQLADAALGIDAALNHTGVTLDHKLTVEIQPPIEESQLERAQTIQALDSARAISTATRVAAVNPTWEQSKVEEETQAILREQGILIESIFDTPDEVE